MAGDWWLPKVRTNGDGGGVARGGAGEAESISPNRYFQLRPRSAAPLYRFGATGTAVGGAKEEVCVYIGECIYRT